MNILRIRTKIYAENIQIYASFLLHFLKMVLKWSIGFEPQHFVWEERT